MEVGIKRADAIPVFIHLGMRKNASKFACFCVQLCSAWEGEGEGEDSPILVKSSVIFELISDAGNWCMAEYDALVCVSLNFRTVAVRSGVESFACTVVAVKVNAKAANAVTVFTHILFYHESCLMRVRGLQ